MLNRRQFLQSVPLLSLTGILSRSLFAEETRDWFHPFDGIKIGLCTYTWGAKVPLPELLDACAEAGVPGIELRCEHAHGVGPETSSAGRSEVKKRFADAGITLVGFGTNEDFHSPDPTVVRLHIERAKAFVRLSADCGGTGVKVKPNSLPEGIPQSVTTAQIAESLDELGEYAAQFGQVIRLENHGTCSPVPIMKEIIDQVHAPNVGLCWNSLGVDKEGAGFEANLRSVRNRLGDTAHVYNSDPKDYPYDVLCAELVKTGWNGWLLIESSRSIDDLVTALRETSAYFTGLLH